MCWCRTEPLDIIPAVVPESLKLHMSLRIDSSTQNTIGSPTTVTGTIRNFGLNKAYGYFFYQVMDADDTMILAVTPGVADTFEVEETRKISFDWTPKVAGVFRVLGFRFIGDDDYGANDSLYSAWMNAFPKHGGAMFDHHFLVGNISRFEEGNGVALRLSKPDFIEAFQITEAAVQYTSGKGPYTAYIFTPPSIPDTADTFYWDDIEILTQVSAHTEDTKLPD